MVDDRGEHVELPLGILLVEDDVLLARALARVLGRHGEVRTASSVAEALRTLERFRPDAAVVDVGLPDGEGFTVLDRLTERYGLTPTLVLTAQLDHETISRAQRAGAQYLAKPAGELNLEAFAAWAAEVRLRDPSGRATLLAKRYGFSPREAEALTHLARGVPRAALALRMNVSPHTLRTLIRRMLVKSGFGRLSELLAASADPVSLPADSAADDVTLAAIQDEADADST